MPNPKEVGEKFLAQILSQVPSENREAVEAALKQEGILTQVGAAVLRQDDYSRLMNATAAEREQIRAKAAEQAEWYRVNQEAIKEGLQAKSALQRMQEAVNGSGGEGDGSGSGAGNGNHGGNRSGSAAIDTSKFIDRQEANTALAQLESNSILLSAKLAGFSTRHVQEYGEFLDPQNLIAYAQQNRVSVDDAYAALTRDKAEAKAKKTYDEAIAKAKEEGKREALAAKGMPYPLGNEMSSTLGGLKVGGTGGSAAGNDISADALAADLAQMLASK